MSQSPENRADFRENNRRSVHELRNHLNPVQEDSAESSFVAIFKNFRIMNKCPAVPDDEPDESGVGDPDNGGLGENDSDGAEEQTQKYDDSMSSNHHCDDKASANNYSEVIKDEGLHQTEATELESHEDDKVYGESFSTKKLLVELSAVRANISAEIMDLQPQSRDLDTLSTCELFSTFLHVVESAMGDSVENYEKLIHREKELKQIIAIVQDDLATVDKKIVLLTSKIKALKKTQNCELEKSLWKDQKPLKSSDYITSKLTRAEAKIAGLKMKLVNLKNVYRPTKEENQAQGLKIKEITAVLNKSKCDLLSQTQPVAMPNYKTVQEQRRKQPSPISHRRRSRSHYRKPSPSSSRSRSLGPSRLWRNYRDPNYKRDCDLAVAMVLNKGVTHAVAAREYNISTATVGRLKKKWYEAATSSELEPVHL